MTGFVSAFGVFRQWYFNNPPFQGNQLITEIGVLSVVSWVVQKDQILTDQWLSSNSRRRVFSKC